MNIKPQSLFGKEKEEEDKKEENKCEQEDGDWIENQVYNRRSSR